MTYDAPTYRRGGDEVRLQGTLTLGLVTRADALTYDVAWDDGVAETREQYDPEVEFVAARVGHGRLCRIVDAREAMRAPHSTPFPGEAP